MVLKAMMEQQVHRVLPAQQELQALKELRVSKACKVLLAQLALKVQ